MHTKCILFLLILVVALNTGHSSRTGYHTGSKECPPQESISKCSCRATKGGPEISCSGLKTDDELSKSISALKGYSVRKLQVSEFSASTWDTELFKGLQIEELDLEKLEVKDASFRKGRRHFRGLEKSLRSLEISRSFRNGHRPLLNLQLDHLSHLDTIILEDNVIPEVGDDWFASGPEKLTTLILERNNIEELGERAFSSLNKLWLLAVAGNHFHTITRQMLPKTADRLSTLDLAYNKIRNLPSDIFSNMPSLRKINLENNLIYTLKEDTWSPIWSQLSMLELTGNPVQCDEDIGWICEARKPGLAGKCLTPVAKKGLSLEQFCDSNS